MVERKKEKDNTPQVDSLLIENAFHSLVAFLGSRGELRRRGNGTEIVADGPDGVKISVASQYSMENLQTLSCGGGKKEDIILQSVSCVRVWGKRALTEDNELILVKSDPGNLRYPPEDAGKMRKIIEAGVQYSVKGRGTPKDLTASVKQLMSALS